MKCDHIFYWILSTILATHSVFGSEFTFEVADNAEECFFEVVDKYVECKLDYQVMNTTRNLSEIYRFQPKMLEFVLNQFQQNTTNNIFH